MRWLSTAWALFKDVLLTGTGIALILLQTFSAKPSDTLLVVGLALTVPSVAGHAGALLSGRPGPSSPPSEAHGPPPSSSSSSGGNGERPR